MFTNKNRLDDLHKLYRLILKHNYRITGCIEDNGVYMVGIVGKPPHSPYERSEYIVLAPIDDPYILDSENDS